MIRRWWQRRMEPSLYDLMERVIEELQQLRQEIDTMSGTLSEQLDAATAAIQASVATVAAEVTTLIGELTPGSTITQAQVDKLTAIETSLKAIPPAP